MLQAHCLQSFVEQPIRIKDSSAVLNALILLVDRQCHHHTACSDSPFWQLLTDRMTESHTDKPRPKPPSAGKKNGPVHSKMYENIQLNVSIVWKLFFICKLNLSDSFKLLSNVFIGCNRMKAAELLIWNWVWNLLPQWSYIGQNNYHKIINYLTQQCFVDQWKYFACILDCLKLYIIEN